MTTETTLHPGGGDLAAIMTIMDEAFDPAYGEAWTRSQCAGILALSGVWLTLARTAGVPTGFSLSRVVLDEAELLLIAVRPAARRGGVGGALLRNVLATAEQRGARRIHLEMREGNPAMTLYSRVGFTLGGRRPRYYFGNGGRLFDALTLNLVLPGPEQA